LKKKKKHEDEEDPPLILFYIQEFGFYFFLKKEFGFLFCIQKLINMGLKTHIYWPLSFSILYDCLNFD